MPTDVATPSTPKGAFASWLAGPDPLGFGARVAAFVANWWTGPLRVGTNVFVMRHADVMDVLSRDLEFRIAPINAAPIEAVSGPFILGMDRGETLVRERSTLYRALAKVDLQALRAQIAAEAERRVGQTRDSLDVVADYARPIAATSAKTLFGPHPTDDALFMDVARAIFGHVFLNLGGDRDIEARALRAAPFLREWLDDEIAKRRQAGPLGADMMGALLAEAPHPEGDDLARRTLAGMLIGSIDTTASCVAKIVYVMGRDKRLAAGMAADVDNFARLHGWCWEALRRWPHNPLVLRKAHMDTAIGSVKVRAGDKIWLLTQVAMLDASIFPDPQVMNPARPTRGYLHLGGGLHPCAGRDVNAFQIPLLVGALVRRGVRSVGAISWAGPFPDRLPVAFNRNPA